MGWGKTDRAVAALEALVTRTRTSGQERESSPQARGSKFRVRPKRIRIALAILSLQGFSPLCHRLLFSLSLCAARSVITATPRLTFVRLHTVDIFCTPTLPLVPV
jgi:hypothetical protein